MENRKKVGLALGSGGVRGLAHIGVLKTLIKHGIPIDYLSGASIGSWVGAHYSLFQDIEKTANFTIGKRKEKLISFFEPTISGGLVKGEKVEAMLNDWFEGASFSDLKIPLKIAATNIISGEKIVFSDGKLAPAVRASMAVPGIFKPVVLKGQAVVDGGLSSRVPVNLVKELGAEVVVAVNLDYFQGLTNTSPDNVGLANITTWTIAITRHHLAQLSCQGADFIIEPPLRAHISVKDYFTKNNEEEVVRIAAEETEKIIPALKEKIFGSSK